MVKFWSEACHTSIHSCSHTSVTVKCGQRKQCQYLNSGPRELRKRKSRHWSIWLLPTGSHSRSSLLSSDKGGWLNKGWLTELKDCEGGQPQWLATKYLSQSVCSTLPKLFGHHVKACTVTVIVVIFLHFSKFGHMNLLFTVVLSEETEGCPERKQVLHSAAAAGSATGTTER